VPNQSCTPNYCNGHGTCSDASGMPVCTCDTGYTGTTCNQCASGYQDSDGNGTCLEDCTATCGQDGTILYPESHGSCVYSGGIASCVCDQGWENPWDGVPSYICTINPSACKPSVFLPECSQCKIFDPPPEYQQYGCPADCDSSPAISCTGDCYYDKNTGEKYCVP